MTFPAGRALLAIAMLLAAIPLACGDDDFGPGDTASPTVSGAASPTIPAATPTPTPSEVRYIVQPGDTLTSIAAAFGVTVEALMAANGITDPNALQVGQVVVIADATTIPSTTPLPSGDPTEAPTTPPNGEVGLLELVDKSHALPDGYVPPDMVALQSPYLAPGYSASLQLPAYNAVIALLDAADVNGHDIRVVSGYRSYAEQVTTFNYWVSVLGHDEAARVSAMPGHSEHQLGTTVDVGSADLGWSLAEGFGETPAGVWLADHAHEYGFALSYPQGAEATTGYKYEPWHWRYIGVDAAAAFKASGQTLNQYLAQFN